MNDQEIARQQAERVRRNTFSRFNLMELEFAERDRAVYRLDIRPESCNQYGMVHGGALYTLADNAAGIAAHGDGRHYVTQHGSLHFLDNRAHGTIRAEGRVRRRGRSTVLVDVDITDESGALLAAGQFSYFCVDERRMAQRAQEGQDLPDGRSL